MSFKLGELYIELKLDTTQFDQDLADARTRVSQGGSPGTTQTLPGVNQSVPAGFSTTAVSAGLGASIGAILGSGESLIHYGPDRNQIGGINDSLDIIQSPAGSPRALAAHILEAAAIKKGSALTESEVVRLGQSSNSEPSPISGVNTELKDTTTELQKFRGIIGLLHGNFRGLMYGADKGGTLGAAGGIAFAAYAGWHIGSRIANWKPGEGTIGDITGGLGVNMGHYSLFEYIGSYLDSLRGNRGQTQERYWGEPTNQFDIIDMERRSIRRGQALGSAKSSSVYKARELQGIINTGVYQLEEERRHMPELLTSEQLETWTKRQTGVLGKPMDSLRELLLSMQESVSRTDKSTSVSVSTADQVWIDMQSRANDSNLEELKEIKAFLAEISRQIGLK